MASFNAIIDVFRKQIKLNFVNPKWRFVLDTDASQHSIGACLSQLDPDGNEHLIACASKTLSPSRQAYCTTKRELYAVVYFMRYFRGYTRWSNTLIRTDHAALKWLRNFQGHDALYARWIVELAAYEPYDIVQRKGAAHVNADMMSRIHRSCKYPQCKQCREYFKQNEALRDSFSEDSDDDERDDHGRKPKTDYSLESLQTLRLQAACLQLEVNGGPVNDAQTPRRSCHIAEKREKQRHAQTEPAEDSTCDKGVDENEKIETNPEPRVLRPRKPKTVGADGTLEKRREKSTPPDSRKRAEND